MKFSEQSNFIILFAHSYIHIYENVYIFSFHQPLALSLLSFLRTTSKKKNVLEKKYKKLPSFYDNRTDSLSKVLSMHTFRFLRLFLPSHNFVYSWMRYFLYDIAAGKRVLLVWKHWIVQQKGKICVYTCVCTLFSPLAQSLSLSLVCLNVEYNLAKIGDFHSCLPACLPLEYLKSKKQSKEIQQ